MLQDFIGFTFNEYHSIDDLNIKRVTNGDRYKDNLTPTFKDTTQSLSGGDGTLYFNTYDIQRLFEINIAFDSLSETQLRDLRKVFNSKSRGTLIFDECPYKAYSVKLQSPPNLSYVCFDDTASQRIYKGTGTLNFIAYYPYAKSVNKFLDDFRDADYNNKAQWAAASGMKLNRDDYYDGTDTTTINLYNAGDIETDWQAFYPINSSGSALTSISLNSGVDGQMAFSSISRKKTNDEYIRINSRTNLIEGCDSDKNPTGSLYNEFLTGGDFFKIPLGESTFNSNTECSEIKYDYLYY